MSDAACTPGARLKGEREQRGLSSQKAADQLHLDAWVIDALEAGDYPRIGPAVYAKGHLKRYAALLGLPPAEILAGFEAQPQAVISDTAVAPSMLLGPRSDGPVLNNLSPLQVAGGMAVLLLALGVMWWKPWHQRGGTDTTLTSNQGAAGDLPAQEKGLGAADIDTAVPADGVAGGVGVVPPLQSGQSGAAAPAGAAGAGRNAAGTAVAAAGATAVSSAGAATPKPAPIAEPANAAVAGTGRARLRMSFSANSWVDVHDADGKQAYAGNGLANSVKTIAGTAPLRVYLGSGSGVQLEINGRAVAIGAQFFSGDVARFEAGADGVLRRDSKPEPRGEPRNTRLSGSPTG